MRSRLFLVHSLAWCLAGASVVVAACVGDDPDSSSSSSSSSGATTDGGGSSSGGASSGATSSSGASSSSGATSSSGGSSGDASPDAPPAWNPGKIAGLTVWLDADDTASFTLAAGSKISKWADKSSAVNDAHGVAGAEPVRAMNATLGKQVVRFAGPSQALAVTDNASLYFQTTDEFVVATVVNFTQAGVGGFVSKTNFPTNDKGILLFTVSTSQVCFAIDGVCGDFTVSTGAFHRIIAHRLPDGTKLQTFVDGVMKQDRTVTATDVSAGGHDLVIGADRKSGDTITEGMTGDIAEVVIYHTQPGGTAITATELTQLDGYLKTKWGL